LVGRIVAVCISETKGVRKNNIERAYLQADSGLMGDAHAGPGHRQVSLLAIESIEQMRQRGLSVGPGDFAENLTTKGLELHLLPVGTRVRIGIEALGEVTQIGKKCHTGCAVFKQVGDCIMPREGIFAKVLKSGHVQVGDTIEVLPDV
jgi:MOSC domain-containing protein YiiM